MQTTQVAGVALRRECANAAGSIGLFGPRLVSVHDNRVSFEASVDTQKNLNEESFRAERSGVEESF